MILIFSPLPLHTSRLHTSNPPINYPKVHHTHLNMSESPCPQNATQAAPDPNLTGSDQLSKVNSHLPLRMNQPSGPKEHIHLPKNVLDKPNNPGASRAHSSSEVRPSFYPFAIYPMLNP